MTDYRKNQKVIATLELEDRGQDFIEIDVLENGVILGDSFLFREGRLSMIGLGTTDGIEYQTFKDFSEKVKFKKLKDHYLYFKETGQKDPLPWKASTFKYAVLRVKKPEKVDRFIKAK